MNYIGSKHSLLPFLDTTISEVTGLRSGVLCDAFAGTSAVGAHFKRAGWRVIANDLQRYSYARGVALLEVSRPCRFEGLASVIPGLSALPLAERAQAVCDYLDALPGQDGFVFANYAAGGAAAGSEPRLYFSDTNARRCDAIRDRIEEWRNAGRVEEKEFFILLSALLEAIDKVANTASVYGAYLKRLKASAVKPLRLVAPEVIAGPAGTMHCRDANDLIGEVSGDVLYLDPPYNARQYAANYHVLETIAVNDSPQIHGKTGLRDYSQQRSAYSSRREVLAAFRRLIEAARFTWIFLSYNSEGLMSPDDIRQTLSEVGEYGVATTEYGRFRADSDGPTRQYAGDRVLEYLHYVRRR